jgi:hypothetical protein
MSPLTDLAGHLMLTPGTLAPHNLRNSRQDWASRIGVGQRADKLPDVMASLFSLCGQSHRLCSRMAVAAAQGRELPGQVTAVLALETATEHVRRIGLDWPRLLTPHQAQSGLGGGFASQASASLQTCPLLMRASCAANPVDRWQGMTAWLEGHCFQMPAQDWLNVWDREGVHGLCRWSQDCTGWLPGLIQSALEMEMDLPMTAATALMPHANESRFRDWANAWVSDDAFVTRPLWQGACAHTGSWTRLHRSASSAYTTGTLLGCRLAELARLCLSAASEQAKPPVLAFGAMSLGANHGMAWVEMARGLLVHQLVLEGSQEGSVAGVCRVLAPTEWNFHPQGVVASVLSGLSGHNDEEVTRRVGVLMAAFDPCVPYEIAASPHSVEKENQGA